MAKRTIKKIGVNEILGTNVLESGGKGGGMGLKFDFSSLKKGIKRMFGKGQAIKGKSRNKNALKIKGKKKNKEITKSSITKPKRNTPTSYPGEKKPAPLAKLADMKIVPEKRKSLWTTPGTPENEKRLAARAKFKKKVQAEIAEGNRLASEPKVENSALIGEKRHTPSRPLNLIDARVRKGPESARYPEKISQKEDIIKKQAQTKESDYLMPKKKERKSKKDPTKTVKYTEKAKTHSYPAGLENIEGAQKPNIFSGRNVENENIRHDDAPTVKLMRRWGRYQKQTETRSKAIKAQQELSKAGALELSRAHSRKGLGGPAPKKKKMKDFKPTKKAIQEFNALFD